MGRQARGAGDCLQSTPLRPWAPTARRHWRRLRTQPAQYLACGSLERQKRLRLDRGTQRHGRGQLPAWPNQHRHGLQNQTRAAGPTARSPGASHQPAPAGGGWPRCPQLPCQHPDRAIQGQHLPGRSPFLGPGGKARLAADHSPALRSDRAGQSAPRPGRPAAEPGGGSHRGGGNYPGERLAPGAAGAAAPALPERLRAGGPGGRKSCI